MDKRSLMKYLSLVIFLVGLILLFLLNNATSRIISVIFIVGGMFLLITNSRRKGLTALLSVFAILIYFTMMLILLFGGYDFSENPTWIIFFLLIVETIVLAWPVFSKNN